MRAFVYLIVWLVVLVALVIVISQMEVP